MTESSNNTDESTALHYGLLVAVLSAVFLAPVVGEFSSLLDEGLILNGADRWLKGLLPYRDFQSPLGPWSFATLAVFFKILGTNVTAAHLHLVAARWLSAIGFFLVGLRLTTARSAAAASLCFLWLIGGETFHLVHHWQGTALFALGLAAILWERPLWAGLLAGMATMTILTKGAVLGLGALPLLFRAWKTRDFRGLGLYVGGFLGATIPWLVYFGLHGALADLKWNQWDLNALRAPSQLIYPADTWRLMGETLASNWRAAVNLIIAVCAWLGCLFALPKLGTDRKATVVIVLSVTLASISFRLTPMSLLFESALPLVLLFLLLESANRVTRSLAAAVTVVALASGGAAFLSKLENTFPAETSRGTLYFSSAEAAEAHQKLFDFLRKQLDGESETAFLPYSPYLYFLTATDKVVRQEVLLNVFTSESYMEREVQLIRESDARTLFYFPAYDRDTFILSVIPNVNLQLYHQRRDDFLAGIAEDFEADDFGAVVVYRRRSKSENS